MNININTHSVFLGIASLAAIAACSKVEPYVPDTPITFTVGSYIPQTRADQSLFLEESGGKFYSKAFLHANGVSETQNFFGNYETISYGTDEWAPSHEYYWPKHASSYVNFVSWFDKADQAATIASTVTETTIKWTGREIATDDNIMFADAAWRYNNNPKSTDNNTNPGPSGTFGKDGVSEGVPTLFHHALARLCFKAKASQVEKTESGEGNKTTWEITLSDMKLTGVYNTGTLELTTTDPGSTTTSQWKTGAGNPAWTVSGTAGEITMIPAATESAPGTVLTTTEADVLPERSVLPQAVTDDMVLSFKYQVVTKYNGTQYSKEIVPVTGVKLSDFTGAIEAWPMNTKITYTITINPETNVVRFDPAVKPWDTLAGGSYVVSGTN